MKKWRSRKRKHGVVFVVDTRCHDCHHIAKEGFPEKSFEACCDSYKASAEFRETFKAANAIRLGMKERTHRRQKVCAKRTLGYKTSRRYAFLTTDEFQKATSKTPSQAGLKIDTLKDEEGETMQGVLLRETGPHNYRTVEVFSVHVEAGLTDVHGDPLEHLRKNQGLDFFEDFKTKQLKLRPPHAFAEAKSSKRSKSSQESAL